MKEPNKKYFNEQKYCALKTAIVFFVWFFGWGFLSTALTRDFYAKSQNVTNNNVFFIYFIFNEYIRFGSKYAWSGGKLAFLFDLIYILSHITPGLGHNLARISA